MASLTWLHLSDWHQKGRDFDRDVVRDKLIEDVRERARIDEELTHVDFVVFSGDIAFSGQSAEYEAARQHFLQPVLDAVKLTPDRLFMVPGNHDLDRSAFRFLPSQLTSPFSSNEIMKSWLEDEEGRSSLLRPFKYYRDFVAGYTEQPSADYASLQVLDCSGKKVALLGLNSALMCARRRNAEGEVDDDRHLVVGEPQIHNLLTQVSGADIKIVVMHHPFDWLTEFDRNRVKGQLLKNCHFVLHGHEHQNEVNVLSSTSGNCVVIPAGASYKDRVAVDPRYTNSYNWVHLDLQEGQGVVFLRKWSDPRTEWTPNIDVYPDGKFLLKSLHVGPAQRVRRSSPSRSTDNLSDSALLSRYLDGLIAHNRLPALTHGLEKYGPPETTEIYIDISATEERIPVDEKELLETVSDQYERVGNEKGGYEWYVRSYAQLPAESPPDLERKKLTSIYRQSRASVLLGDPGSGKTIFLKYITQRFAQVIQEDPNHFLSTACPSVDAGLERRRDEELGDVLFPIRVPIRWYAEQRKTEPSLSLVEYLPRHFMPGEKDKERLPKLADLMRRLLEGGACVVLLDGLDEVLMNDDRVAIAEDISEFVGEYMQYPGNRFVITSRIPGYRYVRHILLPRCDAFQIASMDDLEVEQLVTKRSYAIERRVNPLASPSTMKSRTEERVAGIRERRKLDFAVRTMTSNPLLCGLVVSLYPDIPSTRAELYSKAVEILLSDWPQQRGMDLALQKKQFEMILRDLGYWIHEQVGERYVDSDRIRARFEDRLQRDKYPGITASADRLLKDFLDTSRQTGVFEERGRGLYGFPHLGFEEYFAAKWILDWGTERAIIIVKERLHQPRWREVTLMALSMAPSMVTDRWLRSIKLATTTRYDDILHRNLLFVADCINEGASAGNTFKRDILAELFDLFCDRDGQGRFKLIREQVTEAVVNLTRALSAETIASAFRVSRERAEDDRKRILAEQVVPLLFSSLNSARGVLQADKLGLLNEELELFHQPDLKYPETISHIKTQWAKGLHLLLGMLWVIHPTRIKWKGALEVLFDVKDEALQELEQQIEQRLSDMRRFRLGETDTTPDSLLALCETAGQVLAASSQRTRLVYDNFLHTANNLPVLEDTVTLDELRRHTADAAQDIERRLMLVMQRASDCQRYAEAASVLIVLNDITLRKQTLDVVINDLRDRTKAKFALEVMHNHAHVVISDQDVYTAVLQYLREETDENSFDALRLLFGTPVKAPLIDWCWAVLEDSGHRLHGIVSRYLSEVTSVEGTSEVLALLAAGLNSIPIRAYASRLFKSIVTWRGKYDEILPYLVNLVFVETAEPRIVAALSLADIVKENDVSFPIVTLLRPAIQEGPVETRPEDVTGYVVQPGFREWLELQLAKHALTIESSLDEVKQALADSRSGSLTDATAILLVTYHDLHQAVLNALIDGLSLEDDRIRQSCQERLPVFCRLLPTDGSTQAIQTLYDAYFAANENRDGYLSTIYTGARFRYSSTYWLEKWFADLTSSDQATRLTAKLSIEDVSLVTNQYVLDWLIERATVPSWPQKLRLASLEALCKVFQWQFADFGDRVAQALERCLEDQISEIRVLAAWRLRHSDAHLLDRHINSLLKCAGPQEVDDLVRFVAMKSLGTLLWKYANRMGTDHILAQQIVDGFRTRIQELSTPLVWKGAAVALAKALHGDDKRIEHLMNLLQSDAQNVLEILLLANAELDVWIPQSGDSSTEEDSYYDWELNQILTWIRGQKPPVIRQQVDRMLDILDREATSICLNEESVRDSDLLDPLTGWPLRRFTTIVLAELSDKAALAPSVLYRALGREKVQSILITIGRDPESFNARRFAIRLLGEFEELNADVARVLFAGYKDTEIVSRDSYDAARKFKRITHESLEYLVDQLKNTSLICASSAAMFLGRLGVSIAQQNPEARDMIAEKFYQILSEGPSSTAWILRGESKSAEGTFDDVVFESLLKIVSGQDFDRWLPAAVSHAALEALARNRKLVKIGLDISGALAWPESPSVHRLLSLDMLDATESPGSVGRWGVRIQNSLAIQEIRVSHPDIELVMTGSQEFKSVVVSGKHEDGLVRCLNRAIKASQETVSRSVQFIIGGLDQPAIPESQSSEGSANGQLDLRAHLINLRMQAKRIQDQLAEELIAVDEDDVSVIITGDQKLISIAIAGNSYDQLISIANDAIKRSQHMAAMVLEDVAGGLGGIVGTPDQMTNEPTDASQDLADMNVFAMLGIRDSSEEAQNTFLSELQEVIWADFLEGDTQLLLTDHEQSELHSILAKSKGAKMEDQEEVILFLEKLIPDLEDILLTKALELKGDLFRVRIDGSKVLYGTQIEHMSLIGYAEVLMQQNRWRDATNVLNSLNLIRAV